jgi:hypothetical protein
MAPAPRNVRSSPFDLIKTLRQMSDVALQRNNFNRIAAQETMKEFVAKDRPFDQFNADTLVRRVEECQGAKLDLDDPRLRGGELRRLERTHCQY